MAEIGFLGTGTMGTAICGRLVDAGHDVRVWNRSPEAAEPLLARGATWAATPADALSAPLSFSMLANDTAADASLSEAALAGPAGRIHVNMASISDALADRLTERALAAGVTYVAAPVLGRPPVAAAGKLNILVAGPADVVAGLEPYLSILGARTWDLGTRPSSANVVKIAVNYNIIHAIQALGESIALVEHHDVDPGEFAELLSSTLFGGVVYQGYGKIIADKAYRPAGFTVELGLKDLLLAEESACDVGINLPTSSILRRLFEKATETPELAGADWSALAEVTRQQLDS
jgi:3-hydroxyisobutyrate dehydrogenase-like beta-hydroxyacid dehydrogenase